MTAEFNERARTIFGSKWREDQPSGCWLWTANLDTCGYGRISVLGRLYSAHRISWRIHNGEIPHGICVCHRCDNPSCVNPAHLFLGTHTENMRDMVNKGRKPKPDTAGEKNGQALITDQTVMTIRAAHAAGVPRRAIAQKLGLRRGHVTSIVGGSLWQHVGSAEPEALGFPSKQALVDSFPHVELRKVKRRVGRPRLLTAFGRTQHLVEWARETGINRATIASRLKANGGDAEKALTAPLKLFGRNASTRECRGEDEAFVKEQVA